MFMGAGTEFPGNVVMMDHEKKQLDYAVDSLREHTNEEIVADVESMTKGKEVIKSDLDSSKFELKPQKGINNNICFTDHL
jgi:hypothetical protein